MAQNRQVQWLKQWNQFEDNEKFLFEDWIAPNKLDDFEGKRVLEAGCGGGQHTQFMAPYAQSILAVDLNSISIARRRNAGFENIEFMEADIAEVDLGGTFDIVLSVGVVHHTDDPDRTVENLVQHLKPGGRLILWVYSKEGNWIAEHVVEKCRRLFLSNMATGQLTLLAKILTAMMYFPIYTIYLVPMRWLPYFDYFENFRRLSFRRNLLNVFDKLNAPQVQFISRTRVDSWLHSHDFVDIHLDNYKGVSWRISGTLNAAKACTEAQ